MRTSAKEWDDKGDTIKEKEKIKQKIGKNWKRIFIIFFFQMYYVVLGLNVF